MWVLRDTLISSLTPNDSAALRLCCTEAHEALNDSLSSLRPLHWPVALARQLPSLRALQLDHPKLTLSSSSSVWTCSQLTRLTSLHLGGPACLQLRAHHLAWISQLTNLQELRLRGCSKVRFSVLGCWHSLQKLRRLTLVGLSFTAADASRLTTFLAAGTAATLTSLVLGDLHGLTFLSDKALEGLGDLLGCHETLRVLDLSGCIEVTDAGIQQLAGLAPCLQQLHLHNCLKIGSGAAQVVGTFTGLTNLSLRGCSQLTDAQLVQLLGQLVSLQQLNLQSCSGLDGSFLQTVGSRLTSLHQLKLAGCSALQQAGLRGLLRLQQLRQLSLADCPAVNGAEVLALLAQLPGLTQLDGARWTLRGELCATTSSTTASNSSSSSNDVANSTAAAGGSTSSSSTVAGYTRVLAPPSLQQLTLRGLSCSPSLLHAVLRSLPTHLTNLDLSDCRVAPAVAAAAAYSHEHLSELCRLTGLQALNLGGSNVSMYAEDLSVLGCLSLLSKLCVGQVQPGASPGRAAAAAAAMAGAEATAAATRATCSHGRMSAGNTSISSSSSSMTATSCCVQNADGNDNSSSSGLVAVAAAAGPVCQQQQQQQQQCHSHFSSNATSSSSSSQVGAAWAPLLAAAGPVGPQSGGVAALMPPGMASCSAGTNSSSSSSSSTQSQAGMTSGQNSSSNTSTIKGVLQWRCGSSETNGTSTATTSSVKRSLFPEVSAAVPHGIDALAVAAAGLCLGPAAAAAATTTGHRHWQQQQQPPVPMSWLSSLVGVQELELSFSPWLDDAALASLAGLGKLSRLVLLANHNLTGVGFRALPCLSTLHTINLSGCSSLSDAGLAALAVGCGGPGGQLRELLLPGCRAVSDEGVAALAALQQLRVLDVSSNKSLSSRALAALFPALRHLHTLVVALCGSLCDEGLRQLAPAHSLAHLDLRGCWRLTDEGMYQLLSASTSLMHVNIDGCARISLASCPPHFIAFDGVVGSSQLTDTSGVRRPGVLVRVPT